MANGPSVEGSGEPEPSCYFGYLTSLTTPETLKMILQLHNGDNPSVSTAFFCCFRPNCIGCDLRKVSTSWSNSWASCQSLGRIQ